MARRLTRVIAALFRPTPARGPVYPNVSRGNACRAFAFADELAPGFRWTNRAAPLTFSSLAMDSSTGWVYSHDDEISSPVVRGRSSGLLTRFSPLSALSADGRDLDLERERNLDLDPPPSYNQASTMQPAFDQAAGAPPDYDEASATPPSYDQAIAAANGQLQARATSLSRPSGPTRR
jgi:hypothetical protein